jgi:hypothetical protein
VHFIWMTKHLKPADQVVSTTVANLHQLCDQNCQNYANA